MSALDEALQTLDALRGELARETGALHAQHRERLVCRRGCSACCVDEISVFEIEAEAIRRAAPDLLASGKANAPGACAFLDADGACRVYEARPYVCRTQGLPLRWIDFEASEPRELRDICELNETGPPIEELDADACWELGPYEARLATLQASLDGGALRRVPLRSLFARAADPA